MHKIKGSEAFHLIALQTPVCGIVNLFKIGLVAECRILGQPCNGSLGAIIPFACKEHGKEGVCGMDCGVVPARLSLKASAMPCNLMRFIKSSDMVFWSCCPVTGAVLLFVSINLNFIVLVCLFCNIHVHVCFLWDNGTGEFAGSCILPSSSGRKSASSPNSSTSRKA